ncbi:MAG: tetratricopeptide repeat protein [Kiritimatiellaeota bacterium]|nr:tetratricopeptide repeat protein [Kiritimatiellota bacterium]
MRKIVFAVMGLAAAVAVAQNRSASPYYQGYATDQFEGFEAFDLDKRPEQKPKSFWFGVRAGTPAEQLAYAREALGKGHLRNARKGFEALVREWPAAPEAVEAQMDLARLFEQRKKYAQAFEEYQYLLTFYAGVCPYDEVLDRQFKIANFLLHDRSGMFGWLVNDADASRKRFEQVVRNAPNAPLAPKAMLIVGGIRTSQKEMEEAIKVYDGLLHRYGETEQATDAAYLSARTRYDRATRHSYNEAHCRDAVSFLRAMVARMPRHPQIEQMRGWLDELSGQLEEQCYKNAVFYDTRQRNRAAALMAYNSFLKEFRDSKYADRVRARVAELEGKQQGK